MPLRSRRDPRGGGAAPFASETSFLRNWLRDPLKVGAILPSSRALARAMAAQIPASIPAGSVVVELGPGTGVMTQALLERGHAPEHLVLLEYSRDFCALLSQRFPGVGIVEGDAYEPGEAFETALAGRPIAAILSSLPLMARGEREREAALAGHLARLAPGAPFVQFTYSPTLPVRPERVGADIEISPWIKLNLPPARVLVYRSRPGDAASVRLAPGGCAI